MEPEKLQNMKREQINKEKLTAMISNIVTHTMYLFLLIALATTLNGKDTYYQKEQMERLVKVIMEESTVLTRIHSSGMSTTRCSGLC